PASCRICLGITRRPAGSMVVFMADTLPCLFLPESPDHLVSAQQKRLRNREAEGLGGLEVDGKFELRGLLDGQIARLGALENLVYVNRGAPSQVANGSSISHEATEFHVLPGVEHRGQAVLSRE